MVFIIDPVLTSVPTLTFLKTPEDHVQDMR